MQRRRVLQAILAGTTLAVAGCSGAGGGDDSSNSNATTQSPLSPEAGTSGTGNTSNGSTPTDGATPTEDASGGSDAPTLGSLDVAFENNYRFSVSVPQMGEPVTGAFNGGNFYSVVSAERDTVTTYVIEGENYIVADGFCTQVPNSGGPWAGSTWIHWPTPTPSNRSSETSSGEPLVAVCNLQFDGDTVWNRMGHPEQ